MSAWFRYERADCSRFNGWCAVVYSGPNKPTMHYDGTVSEAHPVPASCLSEDGSPMFGRLREMFPEPTNPQEGV